MANGKKPDTRVVLKCIDGSHGTITLASFWTDGERPSGGLDRRIAEVFIKLEDGSKVHVVNGKENRTHYCNLYTERTAPASSSPAAPARPKQPAAKDDDWGNDLPF